MLANPICDGVAALTSTQGAAQSEVAHVNGAPAVHCTVCEKNVAMKDWSVHVTGKKHVAAGAAKGLSSDELAGVDTKVRETIPAVIPSLKSLRFQEEARKPAASREKLYVNGAPAVMCLACKKPVAMKDWSQHVFGRRHCSSIDFSPQADAEITASLPDEYKWETLPRECSDGPSAPEAYITSVKTLSCTQTQYTLRGDALCGDIPLSSTVPSSWVGSPVTFELRKFADRLEAFDVQVVHLANSVASSYLKYAPEMLHQLQEVEPEESIKLQNTARVDGLVFCYKFQLEKVGPRVRYTRGGAERWLDSGFYFDYQSYTLRSRCGAFTYPFVVSGNAEADKLSRLRAFIHSVDGGKWPVVPVEALKVSVDCMQQVFACDIFSEVTCPKVLGKLKAAWTGGCGVQRAWRVCNDKLESAFAKEHDRLSTTEYCDVDWGFHGTAEDNILSIATNGFDPSKRAGQAFGAGEYFACTPATSISYTRGGAYLFYCKLLIGTSGVQSSYVHGCRYHIIKTAKNTVMALPMYLIQFKDATSDGVWKMYLQPTKQHQEGGSLSVRPVYDTDSTRIPLTNMYDSFAVGSVSSCKTAEVVKVVEEVVKARRVQVEDVGLGHSKVKVALAAKVSGRQLAELRDRVCKETKLFVSIVVPKSRKNAVAAAEDTFQWRLAPPNGKVHEIRTRLPTGRSWDIKKFHSTPLLQQYTSMMANLRTLVQASAIEEDLVWVTSPLPATLFEGRLSTKAVSEMEFSPTEIKPHPYPLAPSKPVTTVAVLCTRILINGAEVEHPAAVLPLYGVFPSKK